MKAWLHRRGKKTWQFEWKPGSNHFWHDTNRGTLYAICFSDTRHKPVWIAKIIKGHWVTCEDELRAREIEFDDGSKWVFPPRNCFGRLKR